MLEPGLPLNVQRRVRRRVQLRVQHRYELEQRAAEVSPARWRLPIPVMLAAGALAGKVSPRRSGPKTFQGRWQSVLHPLHQNFLPQQPGGPLQLWIEHPIFL